MGKPCQKHTAGQWRTDALGDQIWVLDEQGNYLAEIPYEDDEDMIPPESERMANAEVMAVAPEMLEFVQIVSSGLTCVFKLEKLATELLERIGKRGGL